VKKTLIFMLAFFVLASFSLISMHGALAADKVINLKFANFFPTPAAQSKVCEEFIAELEQRTNGKVKVRYFAGGSLLKPNAMIKGVEKGIADIGLSHAQYTPGRFPVMEAAEQPIGYPSAWVANQIMNDFYNKFKPKEFDSVHVMWFHANGPAALMTTKPVRTLEDLKGLTIRAPGSTGDVINALGGTAAPTPMPETYDAIAKNVVQGAFVANEATRSWRFGEVVKYITDTWRTGTSYPFYVVMNKKKYNKLPPDVKQVFDNLCGEYRERFALMWNSIDFGGVAFGKSKGVEYISLSGEETKKWVAAVAPVVEAYVKRMIDAGFKEQEVRGWLKYLEERRDYLIAKQKQLGIDSITGPK
jgi:TRAP-type C4-dicarboxylate transport system substrate-binding protein